MSRLVVIGGSDAGVSAALRAREIDPTLEVSMVVADEFPNFSICGLPFFHSGEVADWRTLAHRGADDIRAAGVELILETPVERIDPEAHQVILSKGDEKSIIPYDRLVVGTGSHPIELPIPGLDLPGVHSLHFMDSSFAFEQRLKEQAPRRALIIGTGYIGLEMARLGHGSLRHQRDPRTYRFDHRTAQAVTTFDAQTARAFRAQGSTTSVSTG